MNMKFRILRCNRLLSLALVLSIAWATTACRKPIGRSSERTDIITEKFETKAEKIKREQDKPQFPWPPPKASCFVRIPRSYIIPTDKSITLSEVAADFEEALNRAGYSEFSYYYVPSGFVLVTQCEQFNADGSPKQGKDRWSVQYAKPKVFSIGSYLTALFTSPPGRFRVIAFVFTSQPFSQSSEELDKERAQSLVDGGLLAFPEDLIHSPYSQEHKCTALIYEFEQQSAHSLPEFKDPGTLEARVHLENSGIWEELKK